MYKRMSGCVMALALLFSGAAGAADWGQVVDDMKFMREEEKLARDVYATLYDYFYSQDTTLSVFNNIAYSEQKHMDAMLKLLKKYGIPDSAVEGGQGAYPLSCRDEECLFNNTDLVALYSILIGDGKASALDALLVGAYIEELDISDLGEAITRAEGYPNIQSVYEHLLCGSGNHLRAFARNIELTGVSYLEATADYLAAIRPDEDEAGYAEYMAALAAILTGDMEHCGKGIGEGPKGPQGPKKPQGPKGRQ
jgi:hypothetical protein